jgi:N-acetylglucosamine kinase-like BadF-type ATPase
VLAGTGSFVHGRTLEGRDLHLGGRGPILDDYGSAYQIGLRGLRAAFASEWTEARRTSLAAAIPDALEVHNLGRVFDLVYVDHIGRRQIAALASTVDAAAEGGDRVAVSCLELAADELAEVAFDVTRELEMESLPCPVIRIGGVARNSRIWWERLKQRLSEIAPDMRPITPAVAPAVGAALLALRQMGVQWTPDLLARASETANQLMPLAD